MDGWGGILSGTLRLGRRGNSGTDGGVREARVHEDSYRVREWAPVPHVANRRSTPVLKFDLLPSLKSPSRHIVPCSRCDARRSALARWEVPGYRGVAADLNALETTCKPFPFQRSLPRSHRRRQTIGASLLAYVSYYA